MKRKSLILLIIGIVFATSTIVYGTYAAITLYINVTNGDISAQTGCFDVTYNVTGGDISGILFQTANYNNGLNGSVSLKINQNCPEGIGKLKLKVNSNVSTVLTQKVSSHCEESNTLITKPLYSDSSSCTSAGYKWVTNGSALKYIIFGDSTLNNYLASGYILNTDINTEKEIYNNIAVNSTEKKYYIYLWLDGNLADNTYTNLQFSGNILAEVEQKPA